MNPSRRGILRLRCCALALLLATPLRASAASDFVTDLANGFKDQHRLIKNNQATSTTRDLDLYDLSPKIHPKSMDSLYQRLQKIAQKDGFKANQYYRYPVIQQDASVEDEFTTLTRPYAEAIKTAAAKFLRNKAHVFSSDGLPSLRNRGTVKPEDFFIHDFDMVINYTADVRLKAVKALERLGFGLAALGHVHPRQFTSMTVPNRWQDGMVYWSRLPESLLRAVGSHPSTLFLPIDVANPEIVPAGKLTLFGPDQVHAAQARVGVVTFVVNAIPKVDLGVFEEFQKSHHNERDHLLARSIGLNPVHRRRQTKTRKRGN